MARKPSNVPTGRGRGRGGGRGRGKGRRSISLEANPSTDVQSVMRRGMGAAIHSRGGAAKKKAIVETQSQGRGARVARRGIQRNVSACPIGKPSAGEETTRNMFEGEDDDAGGVGYIERGLTAFDYNYLSELSALEIALQYCCHAGKAMTLGYWAARRMLIERGVSRALAHENKHLRSELDRLRSGLTRQSTESGLNSSKGKVVLIDLSKEEEADRLEVDPLP